MTTDIRRTEYYLLYRGFKQTANLYSVIRLKQINNDEMGYTDTWLNEMQKDELLKLSEEEFNQSCAKIDFK